ncbi:hypothetical protein [Shimazuella alba]|uniref:Uncharacterized protein n=1 Tax=Shimazuella alba TaxID=2690964 RepID=A0A6I4VNY5_9BACL|nr:hypothetical protein [Shimazuella alba]MXQ53267.1 hypothetical protein [Shimazuella alba]
MVLIIPATFALVAGLVLFFGGLVYTIKMAPDFFRAVMTFNFKGHGQNMKKILINGLFVTGGLFLISIGGVLLAVM